MELIPFLDNSLSFIVKILALVGLGIYLIFSLVVVKQVRLMTNTLEIGFETAILAIAYLHLFLALAVFIISLLIL